MVTMLYGGRKTISGYVSPEVQEKIARAANLRHVSVAVLVGVASEWFADYLLAQDSSPPPLAELERVGLPTLPDPRTLVLGSEGSPSPEPPQRWLFQRREAKAQAQAAMNAAKRKRRATTK
jgi:hypothetical protein